MIRQLMIPAICAGLMAGAALALGPQAAMAEDTTLLGNPATITFSEKASKAFAEDYGQREADYLSREIIQELEPLTSRGYRVEVEVVQATPNRPTFEQLGDRPGLSYQSFGIGGAELRGKLFGPDGNLVGNVDFSWYETDIREAWYESTWGDAEDAIERFARRLAALAG